MEAQSKPESPLSGESAFVQAHLNIVQRGIQGMASHSVSRKTWCIAIVSAILVVISDKGKRELAWLALSSALLFRALDAYHLALENVFRLWYNSFVKRVYR